MVPTFLVVGATGNTGKSVVETLSQNLDKSKFAGYRILALTRSLKNPVVEKLSKLPHVEFTEINWPDITSDWLRKHEVVRAFIASHNLPNHFAEESTFHCAALKAGVRYVVRISTTAANVTPDNDAYYPRQHWAVEALLGSPEYSALQWTSLQPNIFFEFALMPAVELVKQYRKTGKQDTLRLMLSKDAPVGVIDPNDVGAFAGHLLLAEDTSPHNGQKYVMNGPEDINGAKVVEIVERRTGTKVEDVIYKDTSFIDQMAAASNETKSIILSVKAALVTAWEGKCSASTTSKTVLDIYPPKGTAEGAMKRFLGE